MMTLSYFICAVSVFYTLQTFWDLFVFFTLNFRGLIASTTSFDEGKFIDHKKY